jgi:hypothetical protein
MKHIMVVLTNAAEGEDDAFNRWYDETHLSDVLGKGPFAAAQRFRVADDAEVGPAPAYRYLAIYEIEEDRLAEARDFILHSRAEREEALAAGREPLVPISDVLDGDRVAWFFSAVGARREAPDLQRIGS